MPSVTAMLWWYFCGRRTVLLREGLLSQLLGNFPTNTAYPRFPIYLLWFFYHQKFQHFSSALFPEVENFLPELSFSDMLKCLLKCLYGFDKFLVKTFDLCVKKKKRKKMQVLRELDMAGNQDTREESRPENKWHTAFMRHHGTTCKSK